MKPRRKNYRTRWLLPLIFFIGYVLTFSSFDNFAVTYFSLTIVSIVALCLLLFRLNRPLEFTLLFWTILIFFVVAYYFKFYWILLFPATGKFVPPNTVSLLHSKSALISAFTVTTYAFSAFCLTSWFLIGKLIKRPKKSYFKKVSMHTNSVASYRSVASVLLLITPFLIISTSFIMYKTGISVMSSDSVYLPFRLAGWIFYSRILLIPAFLLLLIWCSEQADQRKWVIAGFALLLLEGLGDMVLRSSRGGLALLLLPLGFLFLISGHKIRKLYLMFIAGGLVLVMILFPVISKYRYLRSGTSGNIVSLLSESTEIVKADFSTLSEILVSGGISVLQRFSGVEMLLILAGLDIQPLGWHVWDVLNTPGGIPHYVTFDILRFPSRSIVSVGPSLVGWFYLVGGNALVVVGIGVFTLIVFLLWRMLFWMRLRSLPVAQSLFLMFLLTVVMGGRLFSLTLPLLSLSGSIGACEWLMRQTDSKKRYVFSRRTESG